MPAKLAPHADRAAGAPRRALALAAVVLTGATSSSAAVCTPAVKWTWDGPFRSPSYPQPCTTPLVVQLTDDDGDGRIDGGDRPDVVFAHYATTSYEGVLTAVDGATGGELWTTAAPPVYPVALAAGDLDGDGVVELVALEADGAHVVAFEHDGSFKWRSAASPEPFGAFDSVGLADLDQDGSPEIYCGRVVFGADGALRWQGTAGAGRIRERISNAVDLDPGVPGLELVAGHSTYDARGNLLWHNGAIGDGLTAIADLDLDGDAEVVVAATELEAYLYVLDHQGNILGPRHQVSSRPWDFMAQPVIANLDGDPRPEVVVFQQYEAQALEWDGGSFRVEWRIAIDDSTGDNSASSFDFDGDGAAEVVYHDEDRWVILEGRSGAILSEFPFVTATLIEVPVVADIDGDCEAEILVAGCQGGLGKPSPNQVIAYDCSPSAAARALWNQYGYHATNVGDDGSIPASEVPPWRSHNTWIGQVATAVPVADAGPDQAVCPGRTVTLDASASAGCDPMEYRWLAGATPVCDWSASPTCGTVPLATSTYRVQVACPGGCGVAEDTVVVTVRPDLVPPDLGNTLRAVRRSDRVELSWATVLEAATYRIYRGVTKGVWPPAPQVLDLPGPPLALADVAPPPPLYFYRVAGASCSGSEGP